MSLATIPTEQACWRALACSEAPASCRASAACYGLAEDIGVVAIVVAELKFSQIERQIFLAHVVERPNDSAFEQRPERINVLSVNLAAHVLALYMANGLMRICGRQEPIAAMLIGRNERDPFVNCPTNEPIQGRRICVLDHPTDDVTLARDRADNWNLASGAAALESVFGV